MEEGYTPQRMALELHSLAVLRGLLGLPVPGGLLAFLDEADSPAARRADLYCEFVAKLYAEGGDLGQALMRALLDSDNPAVRMRAAGQPLPTAMAQSLQRELTLLEQVAAFPPESMAALAGALGTMPAYASTPQDFRGAYARQLEEISTRGYGIFAGYHMFTLGQGSTLLPVKNPDPQRLCELTGYEQQRRQILLNTRALLQGLPANNILLYGDAGTGKSSTVKAIGNEYHGKGLRLVEVRKNQLYQIPQLMDTLADNPLKFILFIDDLSFPADDGDFTALKAILEGNISARPRNIVVYATSNRRHMVRESHESRRGSDVHLSDTLEEEASLSARFGLTVTFLRPEKELYIDIVAELARQYDLSTLPDELQRRAEAHALRHGGRSPRTARQFVELVKAEEELSQIENGEL